MFRGSSAFGNRNFFTSLGFTSLGRGLRALALLGGLAAVAMPAHAETSSEYLFDLSADEILRLMNEYVGEDGYDRGEALERMSAPFDCRFHETLCAEIGRDYSYYLLEQIWMQGRRGADPKVIAAEVEALLPKLAESYVEVQFPDGIDPRDSYLGVPTSLSVPADCTAQVVYKDSGSFRLRQSAHRMDGVLLFAPYAQAAFFKKNSSGNYKLEKANRLRVDAQFFVTGVIAPEVLDRSKEQTNTKRVTIVLAGFDIGNAISNLHVEACGKATDQVVIQACACTGPRPEIYEGL